MGCEGMRARTPRTVGSTVYPSRMASRPLKIPIGQSWIDDGSHDEWRFVTLGMAYPNIVLVITAQPSEEITRIISVRKAEPHEENWYRHGHT